MSRYRGKEINGRAEAVGNYIFSAQVGTHRVQHQIRRKDMRRGSISSGLNFYRLRRMLGKVGLAATPEQRLTHKPELTDLTEGE